MTNTQRILLFSGSFIFLLIAAALARFEYQEFAVPFGFFSGAGFAHALTAEAK